MVLYIRRCFIMYSIIYSTGTVKMHLYFIHNVSVDNTHTFVVENIHYCDVNLHFALGYMQNICEDSCVNSLIYSSSVFGDENLGSVVHGVALFNGLVVSYIHLELGNLNRAI